MIASGEVPAQSRTQREYDAQRVPLEDKEVPWDNPLPGYNPSKFTFPAVRANAPRHHLPTADGYVLIRISFAQEPQSMRARESKKASFAQRKLLKRAFDSSSSKLFRPLTDECQAFGLFNDRGKPCAVAVVENVGTNEYERKFGGAGLEQGREQGPAFKIPLNASYRELVHIAVPARMRKRGLGKKVLNFALSRLKAKHPNTFLMLSVCSSDVSFGNDELAQFYERVFESAGWKLVASEENSRGFVVAQA